MLYNEKENLTRINKIKNEILDKVSEICSERAVLITDSYIENGFNTKVMAVSIWDTHQAKETIMAGSDIITFPFSV